MATIEIQSPVSVQFALIAVTQCRENYGSHTWDGTGACPQYWKNKGGNYYQVAELTEEQTKDSALLESIKARALDKINVRSDYREEYVVEFNILLPGELTEDEKAQIEYDGGITYPRKPLNLPFFNV